nr:PREDICTED: nucleolar protein 3-like isoform X2 [Bemisia tabaci]
MNIYKLLKSEAEFVQAQWRNFTRPPGLGYAMRSRPQGSYAYSRGRHVQYGRQRSGPFRKSQHAVHRSNWVPPLEPYIRPSIRPTMSAREKPFNFRMKGRSFGGNRNYPGSYGGRDRGGFASRRGGFSTGREGFSSGRGGFSSGREQFSSGRGGFSSGRGGFSPNQGSNPAGRPSLSERRGPGQ